MQFPTVNRFRKARGAVLARRIATAASELGRDLHILDVGGRPDYWDNVGFDHVAKITLLNYDEAELDRETGDADIFEKRIGDARDLSDHADGSVDLVHSNSVIEHVGGWDDMAAMASELVRVGRHGWVQTPAFEFPIEPHFKTPFMHWFGKPIQRRMFSLSLYGRLRNLTLEERRRALDSINLLSWKEMRSLFPGKDIHVERLVLAKSYSAYW